MTICYRMSQINELIALRSLKVKLPAGRLVTFCAVAKSDKKKHA